MKINYRRKKNWIIKTPVKKVNKPHAVVTDYDRQKEKEALKRYLTLGLFDYEDTFKEE